MFHRKGAYGRYHLDFRSTKNRTCLVLQLVPTQSTWQLFRVSDALASKWDILLLFGKHLSWMLSIWIRYQLSCAFAWHNPSRWVYKLDPKYQSSDVIQKGEDCLYYHLFCMRHCCYCLMRGGGFDVDTVSTHKLEDHGSYWRLSFRLRNHIRFDQLLRNSIQTVNSNPRGSCQRINEVFQSIISTVQLAFTC